MHVQLETGIPTANGYSGHFPKDNWPFIVSSGNHAFKWIKTKHPEKYHKIKTDINAKKWCIVEHTRSKSKIRIYDPSNPSPSKAKWIRTPDKVIHSSRDVKIAKKNGFLYFAILNNDQAEKWIQITNEDIPIQANRGDYRIIQSEAIINNGSEAVLITDYNGTEKVKYIWMINAKTGKFIGQTMIKL